MEQDGTTRRKPAIHVVPQARPAAASIDALDFDPCLSRKLVIDEKMPAVCREQYRRLAASLHQLHSEGLSIVMIASAMPAEGKTLTAINLALTLSQSYQREVLLVDADLRRPSLHHVFGVENEAGLSEVLAGPGDACLPALRIASRLSLLPAGEPTADPMARLTSPSMKRVIARAPETFDWVIVDTPAMALLPDAGLLASMVDGVLMVITARSTRYEAARRAIEALGRGRIVGVVFNRADESSLQLRIGRHKHYRASGR